MLSDKCSQSILTKMSSPDFGDTGPNKKTFMHDLLLLRIGYRIKERERERAEELIRLEVGAGLRIEKNYTVFEKRNKERNPSKD